MLLFLAHSISVWFWSFQNRHTSPKHDVEVAECSAVARPASWFLLGVKYWVTAYVLGCLMLGHSLW